MPSLPNWAAGPSKKVKGEKVGKKCHSSPRNIRGKSSKAGKAQKIKIGSLPSDRGKSSSRPRKALKKEHTQWTIKKARSKPK